MENHEKENVHDEEEYKWMLSKGIIDSDEAKAAEYEQCVNIEDINTLGADGYAMLTGKF